MSKVDQANGELKIVLPPTVLRATRDSKPAEAPDQSEAPQQPAARSRTRRAVIARAIEAEDPRRLMRFPEDALPPAAVAILGMIRRWPGVSQSEIMGKIGVCRRTSWCAVQSFLALGLVEVRRRKAPVTFKDGRKIRRSVKGLHVRKVAAAKVDRLLAENGFRAPRGHRPCDGQEN